MDLYIVKRLFKSLIRYLDIPYAFRNTVYLVLTKIDMSFYSVYTHERRRIKFMTGVIHGTVYSGHPTRTTWGNSMRVYLYTKFCMYLAGITKYKIWVCGDDMLAIIGKNDRE